MLKIYITDLSAYNNGYLVGKWIKLPTEDNLLRIEIENILLQGQTLCFGSNHEEYFITDYEWESSSIFTINEFDDPYILNEKINQLVSLNDQELIAIRFLLSESICLTIEDSLTKLEDVVIHNNTTFKEFTYELINELYDLSSIPNIIANNIDYEGIQRDLQYDGVYYEFEDCIIEYYN